MPEDALTNVQIMSHTEYTTLFRTAEEHIKRGRFEEAAVLARQVYESAVNEQSNDTMHHAHQARALCLLGNCAASTGRFDDALNDFTQAVSKARSGNAEWLQAMALNGMAWSYRERGDYQLSVQLSREALEHAEHAADPVQQVTALRGLGLSYWYLSEFSEALEFHRRALAIDEQRGAKTDVAKHLNNIGMVYGNLGDYSRALDYYHQALQLNQSLGNTMLEASNYGNIGSAYWELADHERALSYYSQSLALYETADNRNGIAISTINIGNVYSAVGDYEHALEYMHRALTMNEALGKRMGIANATANIGIVYDRMGNQDEAMRWYEQGVKLVDELGQKSEAADIRAKIGALYASPNYHAHNATTAEDYLLSSISVSEELGTKAFLPHKTLAELYEQLERWPEFAYHYKTYHRIEREVQSDEATQKAQQLEHRRKVDEAERDRQIKLARFQGQEKILHNILPAQIANRILDGESLIADHYEGVSVFFSDIVGFTKLSQRITAHELVRLLNGLFSEFDRLAILHGLEKIKTIGDAYMAVAGIPQPHDDHAARAARYSLDVLEAVSRYRTTSGIDIQIRVGLHSGNVVAGIIGESKFAYDLWGDAVNIASRMESQGEPGRIQVTEEFRVAAGNTFHFRERGDIDIKGKGTMKTFFLEHLA